jgi:hypothetical protein
LGLHDDVPEPALDPEWCALVRQQAHTLAVMLHRIQAAVAGAPCRTDTPRLQALAADAERLLTAQAQEHVNLEHELRELRALVTDVSQAPAALTQRVQRIERASAVLHARFLLDSRVVELDEVVQPDFCHDLFLQALIFQCP